MKRRGIGNVIATAIMVFLLIFTISQLYIYSFDQLDDYNRVAAQVLNTSGQKGNERISITSAELDVSGATTKVTLTITNPGGTTAHIVDVWMDSVTESTRQHQHCYKGGSCGWSAELYVGSGLSLTMPILDSNMPTNHIIAVKVFTELGVSASVQLLPPGLAGTQSNLLATTQMTLVPTNPITSNDIITLLTISNTNSLGVAFTSLTPDICMVQGNTAPVISTEASGTADSATSTTLTDAQAWTTNQWKNYLLVITSGTGFGQSRLISSNTATELTVTRAWDTGFIPDSTSNYAIRIDCHAKTAITGSATDGASLTLTDADITPTWATDQWANYQVTITSGTGAGQTRIISSNTGTILTVSTAWSSPNPGAGSQYTIQSTIDVSGTAELGSTTTLTDNDKTWDPNQWANYLVKITSAPGAGQTALITSNTDKILTISGTWTSPGLGSQYIIQTNTCDTTTGTTTISPVTCTLVQGPSPSNVSFLQSGGSISFQWIYLVESIVPDSPVTFAASYVNIATTDGLLASQIPAQTATVRQVGGTSSETGQGFSSILGSLTIDITSFQYARNVGGVVCWKTGYLPKGSENTVFRVHVTNIGSTTITLNQDSEYVNLKAATGGGGQLQPQELFIATNAQVSGGAIQPIALPGGGGVAITAGQTVALYFGSSTQNGASAPSLPVSGTRLFTFFVLLGTQTGSVPSFGQSIPFVGLLTAASDPAGCYSGSY